MAFDLDGLLSFATSNGSSDVFLKADSPPILRLDGSVRKLDHPDLTGDEIEEVARRMMSEKHWDHFLESPDHDVAYMLPGVARFRVNIYRQRGTVAMCLRVVSLNIRSFGAEARVLDSGTGIEADSLAVSRGRRWVYWARDGEPRGSQFR